MLSNHSVTYRWVTGNVDLYVTENYPNLLANGFTHYKKVVTKLPYLISRQCAATMTLQQPVAPHAPHTILTDFSLKKDSALKKIEDLLKKGESLFARRQQHAKLHEEKIHQRKIRARSK